MSTIDYSKLPRLAELCETLSDRGTCSYRLTIGIEIINGPFSTSVRLQYRSYHPKYEFNHTLMTMDTCKNYCGTGNEPTSVDEMIATLEQIQAFGFRDQQEVAA